MHEVEERERETLTRLAREIAYRDSGTSANLERLARIAGMVAEELGRFEDAVGMGQLDAPLHDLGTIAIPGALLMKPRPLPDAETLVRRRHPETSHEQLHPRH